MEGEKHELEMKGITKKSEQAKALAERERERRATLLEQQSQHLSNQVQLKKKREAEALLSLIRCLFKNQNYFAYNHGPHVF